MGDVDERDADLALDAHQLELHLLAQLEVERAERLVEQQHRGFVDERPGQRDALLLAARELAGPALAPCRRARPARGSAAPARVISPSGSFLRRRPNATLSHTDRCGNRAYDWNTVLTLRRYGRHADDVGAGEHDASCVGFLEAGDQPQRRGLAAARRAEQGEELAPPDLERDVVDRDGVPEALDDVVDADLDGPLGIGLGGRWGPIIHLF